MIRKLKTVTLQMMGGANVATVLIMLMVGHSDLLNPVSFPTLSNAGLAFPLFLLFNTAFLVFWLLFKPKGAWIPFLGFILCYGPVRRYTPVNVNRKPPKGSIKVISYNVWLFAGWEDSESGPNPILEYLRDQDADIVCLQESGANEVGQQQIDSMLNPIYQYRDTAMRDKGDCISIFSKYPIVGKEHIIYASEGNLSAAFKLRMGRDTVVVINNHLETTGLTNKEKGRFRSLLKGTLNADTAEQTSRLLIHKLGKATATRAPEAEAVARYIDLHRNLPMIVCGDFNDGPISYARRTIADGLTDCYVATGNGPGISYHYNGFLVRIDHIFCSSHFKPYGCYVDNKIKTSDHYPIICWLEKRAKR